MRVDTHGVAGASPSPHYDTLLAKLIVHSRSPSFADAVRRSRRALSECRIDGLATNLGLLQGAGRTARVRRASRSTPRFLDSTGRTARALLRTAIGQRAAPTLAPCPAQKDDDDGLSIVRAPMAARLVQLDAVVGRRVAAGAQIAVLEAMKMEHVLQAPGSGRVVEVACDAGRVSWRGPDPAGAVEPADADAAGAQEQAEADLDAIRPDLQTRDRSPRVHARRQPAASRRAAPCRGRPHRAREHRATCANDGSFIEYGALAVAAQTRRRTMEDLIANTPADGMVTGIGTVNAKEFGPEKSRCVVLAYDYTVLAGTQGMRNHHKNDRMLGWRTSSSCRWCSLPRAAAGGPATSTCPSSRD